MPGERPLAGKTALVTGASRGLGAHIARRLLSDGVKLLITSRDEKALNQQAAELRSLGEVHPIAADLSSPQDVEMLIDRCLAHPSPIDILINNAAVQGPIGPFETADFPSWQAVFQTNFFAPSRICQRLIPPMIRRHWGKIINLSGGGAASPAPIFSAYGASKCALVRFSETFAEELTGAGIDINCVAPGAMNTRMLEEVLAAGPSAARREYAKALKQRNAGGASPELAADLIALLVSPSCDGLTGRLISAAWDPWKELPTRRNALKGSDVYTLRRIVPEDRAGKK